MNVVRKVARKVKNYLRGVKKTYKQWKQDRELRSKKRHMLTYLRKKQQPALVRGRISEDSLILIICLYNRPERLIPILTMIAGQKLSTPIRLILWNNEPAYKQTYAAQLASWPTWGSIGSIELYESPVNIGGIARFVAARYLWEQGIRGPFMMIDDDELLGPNALATLQQEYVPHQVWGWWAFVNNGSHWNRALPEVGQAVDYVGTGGCILDLSIVESKTFFNIPSRFLFLEDQWMCAQAKLRGWGLYKSDVDISQIMEEEHRNQYHALREKKDEFYSYLQDNFFRNSTGR